MDIVEAFYNEWCQKIADAKTPDEFIAHFREHVYDHYDRHNRAGETSLMIWMVGVFNFIHIFEKKFPEITYGDMLFKLCTYHKNHEGEGPEPPFDIDQFMEEYGGNIKEFYKSKIECKI